MKTYASFENPSRPLIRSKPYTPSQGSTMHPRYGFLTALVLAAATVFAADSTRASQLDFEGLNRTLNTGGTVCPDANGVFQNLALLQAKDGSTIYLSFLIQPQFNLNGDDVYNYFGITLNGELNQLFIGKPGADATDKYVFETLGGNGQVPSGVTPSVGQTAFIVVKAQLLSGNDAFTLYVNSGQSEPASGAIKTDLDIGLLSGIGIFSYGAPFCVDEIRVGATYKDVSDN